jgi:hypothetical protein
MTHTVTATVPTPVYRPRYPVFQHHPSTAPGRNVHPYANGTKGRKITVTSESLTVARQLADIIGKVLQDVVIDG